MAQQPESDDLRILSLRGGLNDTDPPSALADDQCTTAKNVEFFYSMLGERRNGCGALTISGIDFKAGIVHLSQWFPTNIVTAPEIIAVGATAVTSVVVWVETSALVWNQITTITDAFSTAAADIYSMSTQSLRGLLFFSYNNTSGTQNRLHLYSEGTAGDSSTGSIIRAGLAQPAAPTAADSGAAGTIAAVRYYRIRYIVKSGTTIVRRSEPSTALTFTPVGNKASVTVTKPVTITEGETHWELEASTDNKTFYIFATTVVATTTVVDSTADGTGYSAGTLSDAIGAYLTIPNAKYLAVDGDRLIWAGHWTDKTQQSMVGWGAVQADPGVGNAERAPIVTTGGTAITTIKHLDNYDGGPLTGIATSVFGVWYAFKVGRIYQANRTSDVTNAYDIITMSTTVGALPGSIVKAVDENGATWIYFLDQNEGPYRIGPGGLQRIVGIRTTWARVNTQASKVICCGCYYATKQQVHWWVSVDGASSPNLKLVLQTSELRPVGNGNIGRGWSTADGRISQAYCVALLGEAVTVNGITSFASRPFIGLTTPDYIQRCDTLNTDAGTVYTALIITKPYIVNGLLDKFGAMNASMLATQNTTSTPTVKFIRDLGVETNAGVVTSLTPVGSESQVIVDMDNLVMSEARMIQVQFSD